MQRFDHRKYRPGPKPVLTDRRWPDRVIEHAPVWASVDLRDGNQALREPMSVTQKQRLWALLVDIGVKQIEVGFPAASGPDFDFVRWLIEGDRIPADVTIQVLTQARDELIRRTFEALEGVPRAIVHVYNSTSPEQRDWVFGSDRDGVKEIAVRGAQRVREEAERRPDTDWTFQYSPESFTATELDYALEVCEAVIDVWQPSPEEPCIINLPATVEVSSPNVFADQVEWISRNLKRRDSVVLSVHTHNDRGGAAAAAELAMLAGADRVEGTLLGNGERTGNMDILTLAMNLYSEGIDPELDLSRPDEIVSVVSGCTGMPVHPRHPWVGELVYTAFSGSHQDAIGKCLKRQHPGDPWRVAYLPIDPVDIARSYEAVVRVNSQSGKGGVAFVMERERGLHLPRWIQTELAGLVQAASERDGGVVETDRIAEIFTERFTSVAGPYRLVGYRLVGDAGDAIEAKVAGPDGVSILRGTGAGAIAAFIDACAAIAPGPVRVLDYQEHALGEGTEAEAAAYSLIAIGAGAKEQRQVGAGIDRDTVGAALGSILAALNRAWNGASEDRRAAA